MVRVCGDVCMGCVVVFVEVCMVVEGYVVVYVGVCVWWLCTGM